MLGEYEATFTVATPGGLKLVKTVKVQGDELGEVTFPDDFRTPTQYVDTRAGRYRWECFVRGEAVTKGNFSVSLTDDDGANRDQLHAETGKVGERAGTGRDGIHT